MRNIAVPVKEGRLSHFFALNPAKSSTIDFCIYHVRNNKLITDVKVVDALVNFESFEKWCMENKITDLIACQIDTKVVKLLNRNKINVFPGVTPGIPQRLVSELIDGTLITNSKVIETKEQRI